MPLKDYLSALRILILDCKIIPSGEERAILLSQKIPDLTAEEIDDLLKIPADRLEVYQRTIFGGELRIITNHFKASLFAIKITEPETPDFSAIIRNMHFAKPWKSNNSLDFAENFFNYCLDYFRALLESKPFIRDLLNCEYQLLLIRRAKDETEISSQSLADFTDLSAAELASKNITVFKNTFFIKSNYNLTALLKSLKNGESPGNTAPERERFYVIARNKRRLPVVNEISFEEYELLSQKAEMSVGDFFSSLTVPAKPDDLTIENFQSFLLRLNELLRMGIVFIS